MQLDGDKIQFETRREIETVETALNTYLADHKDAAEAAAIRRLDDLLDVMHMSW